jgi:ankyrin repeat protein
MASDFFEAIRAGEADRVGALVDTNAELVNARDLNGVSALLTAIYFDHRAIADALVQRGAEVGLFEAAAFGATDRLRELLDHDASAIEAYSSDGWTALHLASFFGSQDAVELLLERGADAGVLSQNAMHNTPLNAASAGGKTDIAKLLLSHAAPVNAQQAGGFTALHAAAYQGNAELTRALLFAGADRDKKNDAGQTAMDMALAKGRQEIVDLLESQPRAEAAGD